MVSIELSAQALKKRLGLSPAKLEEALFTLGMELEGGDEESMKIDIAGAGNRIDTVSFEGLCRVLEGYLGKRAGCEPPKTKPSGVEIRVAEHMLKVRPYIGSMVIRGAHLSDEDIKALMNWQEKVHATFGRDRKRLAIGFYKLAEMKPPIDYRLEEAGKFMFVPLGSDQEMSGLEILERHETGRKYASLFPEKRLLPVLKDAAGRYLSIPGIINSNDVGNIAPGKHDLFIDCTGTDLVMISQLLASIAQDFADRGCVIETVNVIYPDRTLAMPDLKPAKMTLDVSYANKLLGLRLTPKKAADLLGRMLYNVKVDGKKLEVEVPAFRNDVFHAVDLIDDIARAYGYDNMKPEYPPTLSIGSLRPETRLKSKLAEIMVGLGYQQVLSYILSRKDAQTRAMDAGAGGDFVEFSGARAAGADCCRRTILPGLLEILFHNKDARFPQRVFEVGETIVPDAKAETRAVDKLHLAAVLSDAKAGFADIKAAIEALAEQLQIKIEIKQAQLPWYIHGRAAEVHSELFTGHLGEMKPNVLVNFGLEMPTVALELEFR